MQSLPQLGLEIEAIYRCEGGLRSVTDQSVFYILKKKQNQSLNNLYWIFHSASKNWTQYLETAGPMTNKEGAELSYVYLIHMTASL